MNKYTRRKITGLDIRLDAGDNVVIKNHHQPIIGCRTFATTRAFREKRSRSNYRGVKKYDNVYSGFWTEISTDRLNTVLMTFWKS